MGVCVNKDINVIRHTCVTLRVRQKNHSFNGASQPVHKTYVDQNKQRVGRRRYRGRRLFVTTDEIFLSSPANSQRCLPRVPDEQANSYGLHGVTMCGGCFIENDRVHDDITTRLLVV